ncbi:hypothetical protein AK812_SmicGene5031 [Symbiodinium microadriaticum]|uniref:Uncharacterized protein n=1 Tax=Symbiodinium microadriaticum TaxID=2951 RepID=A0A1Q9EUN4_SYMMI|nr:hypothetical protein AK812_SmicGene5031 [Symbiodinium microadriaticum]
MGGGVVYLFAFQRNYDMSPFGKEVDHGLVYCTLGDMHRENAGMARSSGSSVGKQPPSKAMFAPVSVGGLWRWPDGPPLPADVESAITATTVSLPPSVLSAVSLRSEPRRGSNVSACPSQAPSASGTGRRPAASTHEAPQRLR